MDDELELTKVPDLTAIEKQFETAPRWVHESYPGMEKDIWKWLHSYYYMQEVRERGAMPGNAKNKATVSANAHMKSVTQTLALKDATDRSAFMQLYYAHQSGWFSLVGQDSVQELLANVLDVYTAKGAISEITFIVKVLIPELERMGTPNELIFGLAENVSKARASVSTFRKLLAEDKPDEKEITKLLSDVSDPNITLSRFRERLSDRMASREPTVTAKASAHTYLIPGGEIVVIESTPAHTMAIEQSLRGIAEDFSIRTGLELLDFLSQRLTPKKEHMRRYRISGTEVMESGEGTLMPTPEKFNNLCIQEVVRGKFLIDQLLAIDGKALVPIYIAATNLPEQLVDEWLMEAFRFESKKPQTVAQGSFNGFYYPIPAQVMGLWPQAIYEVQPIYQKMDRSWGIYLDIVIR